MTCRYINIVDRNELDFRNG